MKLGMFMMPLHPPHRPSHESYAEDLAKIVEADRLGYDEAWVGEHFSATTEPVTNAMTFLAAALPVTKSIKLCTGVINLPNHNPVIVAGEVAQFDHMTKGRFIMGIGPGGLGSDFEVFGNEDPKEREEKMLESFDIIQKIWSQDPPYDIRGKYWNVSLSRNVDAAMGIGYLQKPYQNPFPPVGLSAMSPFSSSVKRAAARGWSPISANFIPTYSVASHWTKFVEGCNEAGLEPDGSRWRVSRNIIIADSEAEARDLAHDRNGSTHYYYDYLWKALTSGNYGIAMKPDPTITDDQVDIDDVIDKLVIYGTRDTVVEKLRAFREEVGPFGTLLLASIDGGGRDGPAEQRTMRLLKDYVGPRLLA